MNVTGKQKTTIHAVVTRADGSKKELRYLVGGGIKGKLTRMMRKMKGALNG